VVGLQWVVGMRRRCHGRPPGAARR
jgi:hypothetical protein